MYKFNTKVFLRDYDQKGNVFSIESNDLYVVFFHNDIRNESEIK